VLTEEMVVKLVFNMILWMNCWEGSGVFKIWDWSTENYGCE